MNTLSAGLHISMDIPRTDITTHLVWRWNCLLSAGYLDSRREVRELSFFQVLYFSSLYPDKSVV